MKHAIFHFLLGMVILTMPFYVQSQAPAAYQVPDSYQFNYEVAQQVTSDNPNAGGPKSITYFYTTSGEYTALRASSKTNMIMIYTKDGTMVIIDDQKKSITIFRMPSMMGDMSKIPQQYASKMPSASKDSSIGNFKSAKTGNTKQIGGYTAEEYSFTSDKGEKGSVWYAKVDFNTQQFFRMGAGNPSPNPNPMMMNRSPQAASYPQLNDPHLLVTETHISSHPGAGLTTQSINKSSLVIQTKEYKIQNLSNMMGY